MLHILLAAQVAAVPPAAAPDLSWLAGSWIQCGDNMIVEEHWIGPANGVLVGANLTRGSRGLSYEYFRVAPTKQGVWAFHAQPGGQPPVQFVVAETGAARIVFENKAHDFPQRISYWRDGAKLRAKIEGPINGKIEREEWTFELAASARCLPRIANR